MMILFTATTRPLLLLLLCLLLLLACNCINTRQTTSTKMASSQNMLEDEKSRIGSTPPSCHNKCNACHPCVAVQVTTMPRRPVSTMPVSYSDYNNNYKPLGWKCRCGHHLFNP